MNGQRTVAEERTETFNRRCEIIGIACSEGVGFDGAVLSGKIANLASLLEGAVASRSLLD
jgi:hypothetical protein